MAGFATWLVERRMRRVGCIALLFLFPLVGLLSGAVVVMVAALKGPREAAIDSALALAVVSIVVLVFSTGFAALEIGTASLLWSLSIWLGYLVGRHGSLTLALQAMVMICALAPVVIAAGGWHDELTAYWLEVLQTFVELSREAMDSSVEPFAAQLPEQLAPIVTGVLAASVLGSMAVALFIGSWLACGLRGSSFAAMFRELRLGYLVGGIAAVAGIAALAGLQPLAGNVLLVMGTGFVFQGLAVVYWWAWRRQWPGGWWVILYLPVIISATPRVAVLVVLVTLGFIDNWYRLRPRSQDMV